MLLLIQEVNLSQFSNLTIASSTVRWFSKVWPTNNSINTTTTVLVTVLYYLSIFIALIKYIR